MLIENEQCYDNIIFELTKWLEQRYQLKTLIGSSNYTIQTQTWMWMINKRDQI
jgi:hypothetical protein